MRKKNAMVRDKLCYQMATSMRVNITMEKDMDSENTNLSGKRQGNERTTRLYGKNENTYLFFLRLPLQS